MKPSLARRSVRVALGLVGMVAPVFLIQIVALELGIRTFAGLTINGSAGLPVEVQFVDNEVGTNWATLTNFVLPYTPYVFCDLTSPVTGTRFYRAVEATSPPGMVLVQAGEFQMGQAGFDPGEEPVHTVFASSFYMDRFEVTGGLWHQVYNWASTNGYTFDNPGQWAATNHPVVYVTWFDVVKWCNARSEKEGLTPSYYEDASQQVPYRTGLVPLRDTYWKWNANGYRLPTEAEWEKAARGKLDQAFYPWGYAITGSDANFEGSGDPFEEATIPTTPVGYYNGNQLPAGPDRANGYGLYDMTGNVAERCWDFYEYDFYSDPRATAPDTHGPLLSSSHRVYRGGSWDQVFFEDELRCSARSASSSVELSRGFRCVRVP